MRYSIEQLKELIPGDWIGDVNFYELHLNGDICIQYRMFAHEDPYFYCYEKYSPAKLDLNHASLEEAIQFIKIKSKFKNFK